jgi:hypothetical protein
MREGLVRISGYGAAAAGLGQLGGLLLAIPFATGAIYWVGHRDESQVFLPAILAFALLAFPLLFLFREKVVQPEVAVHIDLLKEARGLREQFRTFRQIPGFFHSLLLIFSLMMRSLQRRITSRFISNKFLLSLRKERAFYW